MTLQCPLLGPALGALVFTSALLLLRATAAAPPPPALSLQNDFVRLAVGSDGRSLRFVARATGIDYLQHEPPPPFATLRQAGRVFPASALAAAADKVTLQFGAAGVTVTMRVRAERHWFLVEVTEVRGAGVEELDFADVPLTLMAAPTESFAGCALALNLQTNVRDIPGASRRLWAACYPRFGFVGAKVALIGCPSQALRRVLQEVVSAAPDLPHSPLGGPWALDASANRGSYLFNFGNLSEAHVQEWIDLAHRLGVTQIDFHGGNSFRFGDCLPNPQTYPQGWASFKAVIDRLHAAGLQAGLHTYAEFLDKHTPWVTPVPDPRLGKDAVFTLAAPLAADASTVPVVETTRSMSAVTGFATRNSVTLQIDDELITYRDVAKAPPFAFTGCRRGAWGTHLAAHAQGAKVSHLKECFGLFVPEGDSTLFTEVAAKTAQAFNAGGFDMIYLDALDGSDVVAGAENAWHYQAQFTFEIWKHLRKPAIMEMSTFSHHLWCVRSRMGAWDHPRRAYRQFIDLHVAANADNQRRFLPGQLGWWALETWDGAQTEPTFPEDLEYLMVKALGTDTGFALMGVDPNTFATVPAYRRLAPILHRYEALRRATYFSSAVTARLRQPGREFTLVQAPQGEWQFHQLRQDRHRIEGLDGGSDHWTLTNGFARQPLHFRLEVLLSAAPYDAPDNPTLTSFEPGTTEFGAATPLGVTGRVDRVSEPRREGASSARFTATNPAETRRGAWARAETSFAPPRDLGGHAALGVWVHGDGQAETLNFQLRSPAHLVSGIADHYVIVDFTGWRYFELIEPEAERFTDYLWPYGDPYAIYRESVVPGAISSLSLYYNNLPPHGTATCYLSPVRGLRTITATWRNPALTLGGQTLRLPVELTSGCYLEFRSRTDCRLYGPKGELLARVQPQGEAPFFEPGPNDLRFACEAPAGVRPRARFTAFTEGEIVRGVNPRHRKLANPAP